MKTINELINLKGRKALITGATGNLGKVFSETLAELGADLILVDLPGCNFEPIIKSTKSYKTDITIIHCNLEIEKQRKLLIEKVKTINKLDILINNAAFTGSSDLSGWSAPFENQSIETWRRAIEVNLTASFHLCQGLNEVLKLSSAASIINIASIYGTCAPQWELYDETSMSNPAAYGASKAGLIQLTKWLAKTVDSKIRVNALSPGGVFRNQPQIFVDRYAKKTAMKRMAIEEDFKGAIAYLASDLSIYVTGQNIIVDGGWSL